MKVQKAPAQHGPFHTLVTVLASLVVLAGIVMGIWLLIFFREYEETNDAQVEQYVTPVISRITGYLQEVRFTENQFVHKGDTLIIIDCREYKAHLEMALAELDGARNVEKALGNNVAVVHSGAAIHQSQVAAAQVQLWKAEQEYKRYAALEKEDAATKQQTEQMKANFVSAKAKLEEIQRTITSSELSTEEATAKLPAAKSTVSRQQAAVDNAALYLSYTVITAPYNGYMGRKTIQPCQMVKEGQTLTSVVSHEKWITANFKETQVGNITVGKPVTFKADATGGKVYHGVIESFSPASGARFSMLPPDNATGNFIKIEQRIPVHIRLTDDTADTDFLRAGMNVTVTARHN